MDSTNTNSTKGSGKGWMNFNGTSSFGRSSDTAKAQSPNNQEENKFSTTSSIDSFCQGPADRGGSAGSFTSFPGSSSSEGANSQARTQMMMQHSGTNRFVEVSEDDQEPRSTMRSNGNDCAGKGMPSLNVKEDNTDNDKDASIRSSSSTNRGNESPSATETGASSDQDVAASYEGIKFYSVNDVLCGRGGGTNVHPGNRRFRDLVNANRRAYLKAKKNDKPTISRSIVRGIRQMNGRFLKKDEKKDLWFEIGDDCAREKTSQALRQRAPEMRKILLEDEQRQQQQQQQVVEQQMMLHRQQLSALVGGGMGGNFSRISQMNALASMGGNFNPSAFSIDNQLMGQVGNVNNLDPSQSLLAKYNTMLQQKNWLAQQQQNMILQRLTMSGINPQSLNVPPQHNPMDSMATQGLLHQGFNPVVTRGA
ncbi:hypothetical protein ACHAWU_000128 [Discostella pseudostelligera]|uniref:DUF6824 domain-containing protein n=1 Tax=Discostella pseudostelligera TaxID=259834 RepID=A0ABD3MC61_9STRA